MTKKRRTDVYYQLPKCLGLEELTDVEAGKLFKAINRYNGERETLDSPGARILYGLYCEHIDEDRARYEEYCEKQKTLAKRRWGNKSQDTAETL